MVELDDGSESECGCIVDTETGAVEVELDMTGISTQKETVWLRGHDYATSKGDGNTPFLDKETAELLTNRYMRKLSF